MKFKDTKYGDLTGKFYRGDIDVCGLGLTSLEGAPKGVEGDFMCSYNQLTTLKGIPIKVGGFFDCSNNKLTLLKGLKTQIEGSFISKNNPNPFLEYEYEIRKSNPNIAEQDVAIKMFEKYGSDVIEFYPDLKEIDDIFVL